MMRRKVKTIRLEIQAGSDKFSAVLSACEKAAVAAGGIVVASDVVTCQVDKIVLPDPQESLPLAVGSDGSTPWERGE